MCIIACLKSSCEKKESNRFNDFTFTNNYIRCFTITIQRKKKVKQK